MVDRLQEGRTPLHYAAALQGTTGGVNQLYSILAETGADENVVDVVSFLYWNIFNSFLSMTVFGKYFNDKMALA